MVKGWTLSRRITALCTAVGVLLALIAVGAMAAATSNRVQMTRLVDRIGPAQANSEKLLAAILRQQAGVRTFAGSGKPADLAGFDDGLATELSVQTATAALLAREPRLLAELREIRTATEAWRADTAQPLINQVRVARAPVPERSTPTDEERTRFQSIVDQVIRFQNDMLRERAVARKQTRESSNLLIALLICAGGVVVFGGVLLAMLLSRLVTRPVVNLAAEVRRVAKGRYDYEIHSTGPPELARLARDVDSMRQQIAADLDQVRRAQLALQLANEQLERQAEELTRSNRDLEQFAYVASHDLQEPLRKVASFCQLLQRRYAGQLDERADQYIAFAVDGAQRMQRLINDLLAFSRIGRITSGFADVDLDRVMAEVTSQLEVRRDQVEGEITWSDLPLVRGEEPLLSALLVNLISNSLKFRQPGSPPKVHISARREGDFWEISCQDNGIGISGEFADKVFVIFQRLHPKDQYPGTGIGLAIAKKIVEYHGGHIWLDTSVADGTLIRFTLPVTTQPEVGGPVGTGLPAVDPVKPDAVAVDGRTANQRSDDPSATRAPAAVAASDTGEFVPTGSAPPGPSGAKESTA